MSHFFASAAVSFGCSYFVAAACPGPNFVLVSRAGLAGSREASLCTAAGVVFGASALTVFAVSCAQWLPRDGRGVVFAECLFAVLLLRWAVLAIGSALGEVSRGVESAACERRPLFRGFLTAASNPFTAAFLATAADRSLSPPAAAAVVFVIASAWFGFVGLLSRRPWMHGFYARRRRHVEALFGVLFLSMAARTLARVSVLL